MSKYCRLTSKSLIDFEEIKFILANSNIELISSNQIKERAFLKNDISFVNANYKTIVNNLLKISDINGKKYLIHETGSDYDKEATSIEINSESDCVALLNHIGYSEQYVFDADHYVYSDGTNQLEVLNLINIGLYLSVKKEDSNEKELKEILSSFHIPYDEDECNESIEKIFINKLRRQMK
jgi:adenylate cyclase class IV